MPSGLGENHLYRLEATWEAPVLIAGLCISGFVPGYLHVIALWIYSGPLQFPDTCHQCHPGQVTLPSPTWTMQQDLETPVANRLLI